jgi:hypothetical protein
MSFFEIMDLASSIARLIGLVAVPFVAIAAMRAWSQGKQVNALYWLGWAIFLKQLSVQ